MAKTAALAIRGRPRRLTWTGDALGDATDADIDLPSAVESMSGIRSLRLSIDPHRHAGKRLRLRLPPTAPPGSYPVTLRVGGKSVAAILEIEPAPALDVSPRSLVFEGWPGATMEARATVTNVGNVGIAVPETVVVGLYDDDGIEAAFADTYQVKSDDANVLVGHWLRKLREGHAGTLKLKVVEGYGTLEPGASRVLVMRGKLPAMVKSRHSYHGVAKLDPAHLRVRVNVQKQEG